MLPISVAHSVGVSITNLEYISLLIHYVTFEIGKQKASFYIFNYIFICIASEGTASRKFAVLVCIVL